MASFWVGWIGKAVCWRSGDIDRACALLRRMTKVLDDVATAIRAGYKRQVDELPSTGQTTDVADVAIIGAGFAGLATAWSLLQQGVRKVVVLERDAVIGTRASGRNAGLGRQIYDRDDATALAVAGVAWLRQRPEVFAKVGSILTFDDPAVATQYEQRAIRHGVECRRVFRQDLEVCWPAAKAAEHLLWFPGDGLIDPAALAALYAVAIRHAGGRIVVDAAVTGVTEQRGGVVLHTARGDLLATIVVDAAGAWASAVARTLGADALPLRPIKRHIATTRDPRLSPSRDVVPFVWHFGSGGQEYYLRTQNDHVMISACDARDAEPDDDAVDDNADAVLRERFGVAASEPSPWLNLWSCSRTFAHDGPLLIAADPQRPWLAIVGGLASYGATVSSVVGERAAALVTAMLALR